jgi:hypothetical protein
VTSQSPPGTARTSKATVTRATIPWSTVLTFAGVLTVADWFWVISLRGAVGAIERTRDPFISWVQGSALLLPLFAFAVLGALALAVRRFGTELGRPRAVVLTGLFIAVACTLAGLAALLVSGAYDYRLQIAQLAHLAPMGVQCVGSCVEAQRDATLVLQLKALGAGAGILLVTNLLLVGWMVAVRGGRLSVSRSRPVGEPGSEAPATTPTARWGAEVQLVLVAALVGTGTILATHATADLLFSVGASVLFLVAATVQLATAQLATARPGRSAWIVAGVLALGLPALWLYARTGGNPLAPVVGNPGGIGLAEGAVGVLELATLAAALLLLSAPAWMRRAPASPHAGKLGLVAIVAATAIGIGGSGLAMFDLGGVDENPTPGNHHAATVH